MVANIFISDVIGEDTTLENVRGQYAMYDNPTEIRAHINSVGGDVVEGYAIHDYLRSLRKKVTTIIEGKCYSIATIIALAGDERLMSPNSEWMIHNPWMEGGSGDSAHYAKIATELSRAEKNMADFYAKKTGLDKDAIRSLMKEETYMDLAKAKSLGFVTNASTQLKAVAQLKNNMEQEKEKKALSLLGEIKKMLGMGDEEETPKALIETELEDGVAVVIEAEEGDELVGKEVFLLSEEGRVPAPNGTHTLADGTTIEVESGVITAIAPPAEAKEDDDEMAKMKEEMEALKAENESLKAEKEEAIQAKAKELEAIKAESENNFKALSEKMNQLNALVITEDAPKALKKNVGQEPAKHKFDNLIAK